MKIFIQLCILNLFLILSGDCLQAQQRSYLLDEDKKPSVSGFISIDQEFFNYKESFAASTGGSFGILFNQQFYVGAFGSGMVSPGFELFDSEESSYYPGFGHGGLMFGGIIGTDRLLHLDLNAKFGFGGHKIEDNFPFDPEYDLVFTIQPTASVELNVSKFFKVKAGVGYRYASGFIEDTIDKNVLNSPTGSISFIFGWFGQNKKSRVDVEPIGNDQIRL